VITVLGGCIKTDKDEQKSVGLKTCGVGLAAKP